MKHQLWYVDRIVRLQYFLWVTAGDSSAAGHGNLYSQSYTAILEETVQHHFELWGYSF